MPVEISQFIYGNSLVNYSGGSAQSNVPYWMGQFSEAAGNSYAANGGYGFLRQFSDREEPANEWGFEGVEGVWDNDYDEFGNVSFNSIIITPGNFIQDQDPDEAYFGDSRSPLDVTIETVRETLADQPDAQIYIYEGWADLGSTFGYPVSTAELTAYQEYNAGEYHDWYVEFVEGINEAVPGADVQLIPVASVMAELFTDGPLSELTLDDLYVDSAPHGTETLYFLASMITYSATFGEAPPADFEVPDTVHSLVADNYDALNTRITELLNGGAADEDDTGDTEEGDDEDGDDDGTDEEGEINTVPTVGNDVAELNQDETVVIDVLANDSDADGDTLSIAAVSEAEFGSVEIIDGRISYTPEDGFVGSDSFTYGASDGEGGVVEGRVDLQVLAGEDEADEDEDDETEVSNTEAGFTAAYFELGADIVTLDQVDFSAAPSASGAVDALQYLEVNGSFVPESGVDHFAAQYTTTIDVTEAGWHEIFLVADDDARVMLDGEDILGTGNSEPGDLVSLWIDLDAGTHDLQVQYLEVMGEQSLNLDWSGPSTGGAVEPMTGYYVSDTEDDEDEGTEETDDEVTTDDGDGEEDGEGGEGEEETDVDGPTTEFSAQAFSTDAAQLSQVDFTGSGDASQITQGVTLASEDGALLESGPDDGAVQFTTQLTIETAGLYDIGLSSDDQALVSISGLPVVSTDASDGGEAQSNSIFLIAGQHNIEVTYLDTDGSQALDVTWSGPDTDGEIMPLGDIPNDDAVAALFSDAVAARSDEEAFAIAQEEDEQAQANETLLLNL